MRFDVELINIITAESAYENVHKRVFKQNAKVSNYFFVISSIVLSQRNKWFTIA